MRQERVQAPAPEFITQETVSLLYDPPRCWQGRGRNSRVLSGRQRGRPQSCGS